MMPFRRTYTKYVALAVGLLVPFITLAQEVTKLQNPMGDSDPIELFARFVAALYVFASLAAFVWVVAGGFRILGAAGNSERYEHGKKMIVTAILGLIVTIGSYAILATVMNVLVTPSPQGTTPIETEESDALIDPLNLKNESVSGCLLCPAGGIEIYGGRLLRYMLNGLGALTLLMFILGGLTWFTAGGNEERVAKAKKILQYAVIGVAVVLAAYMIVYFVLDKVLLVFKPS